MIIYNGNTFCVVILDVDVLNKYIIHSMNPTFVKFALKLFTF